MLLIASAFYYLNRVDSDCGTTFSWVTRAMGPWFGWIGGWAIGMTGVLIVGSLANVGVTYFLLAIGADESGRERMGRQGSHRCADHRDDGDLRDRHGTVRARPGCADHRAGPRPARVRRRGHHVGAERNEHLDATTPEFSWLNPFGAGGSALTSALLLGVFAYWGWESAVNLNEETEGASSTPGRAAIASTVVLLVTYVAVAIAVVAYAGVDFLSRERRRRKRRSSASSRTR